MIRVRHAESDADLRAWIHVRRELLPNESAGTVEELRARTTADRQLFVAELDGALAGSGLADRSALAGRASLAPRVLPGFRGRGVGSALLADLAAHALRLGFGEAVALVDGRDERSLAFARRYGFVEVDRQVEQVRALGHEPEPPPPPAGVELVSIGERPELLHASYELARPGYADMATDREVTVPLDEWLREEATLPHGSFAALADGEVVGYSGLCRHDSPGVAEDGLTVVRRDWRRRGLATALKRRELTWAAANGLREVVTWTQQGNEAMRRVNESLGFTSRDVTLTVAAPLPLET
ncbi:MAG TPA: GNAT family N-acetyltransferase [Gaiellaceae bacterium]|jgi:L-amino acid N-acyltransferase YncA